MEIEMIPFPIYLRVFWNKTAPIIIAPVSINRVASPTALMLSIFSRYPIVIAPIKVRPIPPFPPMRFVPPITTIAMAVNS